MYDDSLRDPIVVDTYYGIFINSIHFDFVFRFCKTIMVNGKALYNINELSSTHPVLIRIGSIRIYFEELFEGGYFIVEADDLHSNKYKILFAAHYYSDFISKIHNYHYVL